MATTLNVIEQGRATINIVEQNGNVVSVVSPPVVSLSITLGGTKGDTGSQGIQGEPGETGGGMDELIYDPGGVRDNAFDAANLGGYLDCGTFN